MTDETRAELLPVAWCDDLVSNGEAGNLASAYVKKYWAHGHWADKMQAERLTHPLYSANQLATALAAERTRCAAIARAAGREDIAAEIEGAE